MKNLKLVLIIIITFLSGCVATNSGTTDKTPPQVFGGGDMTINELSDADLDPLRGVEFIDNVDGVIDNSKALVTITDLGNDIILDEKVISLRVKGSYFVEIIMFDNAGNHTKIERNIIVGGGTTQPDDISKCKGVGYVYNTEEVRDSYELVWADEFDYEGKPNTSFWKYQTGAGGWGNNELQYYTAGDNADVRDGNLVITAKYEDGRYTSTRINTRQSYLYGKFEIRAKLPDGRGLWPAIWMMPQTSAYGTWPNSGEIDIMEYISANTDKIFNSLHMRESYGGTRFTSGMYTVSNVTTEYHTYGIEWFPDRMIFLVDDVARYVYVPRNESTCPTYELWPFDQEFHFIMNIAVGGNLGGTVDNSIFPKEMLIDYIRVYQSPIITNLKKTS